MAGPQARAVGNTSPVVAVFGDAPGTVNRDAPGTDQGPHLRQTESTERNVTTVTLFPGIEMVS